MGRLVLGSPYEDLALELLAWFEFGFRELRSGNLAFWNPHIFSGLPFFATFESGLLYPPNWLHLLLPVGWALNILLCLHLFLAGGLTYAWCRRSGQDPFPAATAGVVFMLSSPYYLGIYGGLVTHLWVMTWIPAVFLCLDSWISERKISWLLAGMAVSALQCLGGNPQLVYYTALGAGLYLLLRLPGEKTPVKLVLGGAAVFGGGLALAAVQLLPGAAAVSESSRSAGLSLAQAGGFSLPPENILTLTTPFIFGDMRGFPYFGRCHLFGSSLFIGVSGLLLSLCGALGFPDRRRRIAGAMACAAVLLALGSHLKPLYWLLYHLVPGFGAVRGTQKFLILASLFLAWLAGQGLQDLLRAPGDGRTASSKDIHARLALGALASGALAAAAGFWAWASGPLGSAGAVWTWLLKLIEGSGECLLAPLALIRHPVFVEQSLANASARLGGTAALLTAAGLLLWLGRGSRRFAAALGLLAVLELFFFCRAVAVVMDAKPAYPAAWMEAVRAGPADARVLHAPTGSPNIAMRTGLSDVLGYCPLPLKRYVDFLSWTQGLRPDEVFVFPRIRRVDRVFELLRLGSVFSANKPLEVQNVPSPMSRLHLLREWKLATSPAEALELMSAPGFDPRTTVILESVPDPAPAPPGSPLGWARLTRSGTDSLEIEAALPAPAILLVTDSYAKDWRCRFLEPGPQSACAVLPADSTLRAVPLAAGRHRLVLEYRPAAFVPGLAVTLAALMAWLAAWVLVLRRRS
jgi:hypothetical protein